MCVYSDEHGYWPEYVENTDENEDEDEGPGPGPDWYGRHGALLRRNLVSKLWYYEAMRYLWKAQSAWEYVQYSLTNIFANIDPARRQFYAHFIESGNLRTVEKQDASEYDSMLRNLKFPRLGSLYMQLTPLIFEPYVPKINSHRISILEIAPPLDRCPIPFQVSRNQMDVILERIAVCFVLCMFPHPAV